MIKKINTVSCTYFISDLNSEEIFRMFNKKNCKKTNQREFKKAIVNKRKGDNHCVKSVQTRSFFWSVFS